MAASNTFSPDAVLGGPIVHALHGKLGSSFTAPMQIERGQTVYYGKEGNVPTFHEEVRPNFRPVLAAEAVAVYKCEQSISVPVVLGGRCMVNMGRLGTPMNKGPSEHINAGFGMTYSTIHETNHIRAHANNVPMDVFMRTFAA